MSFFSKFDQRKLSYSNKINQVQLNIDEINDGFSQNESFLFYRNNGEIKIFDRICNHNGGRLTLKGEKARCPLHGWELDLESQMYINARCEKKPILRVSEHELDSPYINVTTQQDLLETHNFDSKKTTTVRFLNHACLHFSLHEDFTFATDPWVIGSAFSNGWWLDKKSPSDVFQILNECNFIYISHNHPDHLHPESLRHIRKDMPILTAGFSTESTLNLLKELGFKDIFTMDFSSCLVETHRQLSLSVLKSGDFRDDSGLLIENGNFKCLLTVDSNYMNFGKLPSVDLLCSSFSGGASGFPLCFENYTENERDTIIARNRSAIKATNIKTIQSVTPRYFMPYAGFFTEKAERDNNIKKHNIKNTIENYNQICDANHVHLLNLNDHQIFRFEGYQLKNSQVDSTDRLIDRSLASYMTYPVKLSTKELSTLVIDYFRDTTFKDNLLVDLITTNEDFSIYYERFKIDFNKREFINIDTKIDSKEIERLSLANESRYLRIKVRREEFANVIRYRKPWEDLSIGFQCRIYRKPNVYNSDFWFYFTNQYIGSM